MTADEQARADAQAILASIEAVAQKITEALASERYVEAAGWSEALVERSQQVEGALGDLAAVERLTIYGKAARI